MEEVNVKALETIVDVTDVELEQISGAGDGAVRTLTTECYMSTVQLLCCIMKP